METPHIRKVMDYIQLHLNATLNGLTSLASLSCSSVLNFFFHIFSWWPRWPETPRTDLCSPNKVMFSISETCCLFGRRADLTSWTAHFHHVERCLDSKDSLKEFPPAHSAPSITSKDHAELKLSKLLPYSK